MTIQKAFKLREKVIQKIQTNEYNLVTINTVKCSRSDLEDIVRYCELYINTQGTSWGGYMQPMGNAEKVLMKNSITVKADKGWY